MRCRHVDPDAVRPLIERIIGASQQYQDNTGDSYCLRDAPPPKERRAQLSNTKVLEGELPQLGCVRGGIACKCNTIVRSL